MKKVFRSFIGMVSGSKGAFLLEHRLFNLASFFITAFAFISIFINYFIGLQSQTIWLSLLGMLASGYLYYLARIRSLFSASIIFIYLLVAMGILSSLYFYNGGLNGSIIYVYLMLLNIVVLIMPRRYQYWVFGVLYTGIVLLVGLEFMFPDKVVNYHSRQEKMLDHLICLFFSMLFTASSIVSFRKSYYTERARTRRRNMELKELNGQMEIQRQALEEAVLLANERRENIEVLLNELNHRVKNNLQVVSSLLKLQAQAVVDESAKNAILESRNRLSSMILVHKRLYLTEDNSEIYMPEYLQELMESVMYTYQGQLNSGKVTYALDPVWLKVEKAIPVGLISNELITNCFKHTLNNYPDGKISVSLSKAGDNHLLSVSDNGPGLSDQPQQGTFGMKLVKSLVTQLNGTYKINCEKGTSWEIAFN